MPNLNRQKKNTVKYTGKDFESLKNLLIEHTKTYFPNTYQDFNETSPGMMMIEMSAYVGDVLSFYLDQQYREMLLPLASERKNVLRLSQMMGYKTKNTSAAQTTLTFTQKVSAKDNSGGAKTDMAPDWSEAVVLGKGVVCKTSGDISFTTLSPVDFTVSSSIHQIQEAAYDSDGIVSHYNLKRDVKAIQALQKAKTFPLGPAVPFKRLQIEEIDVIDIVSVVDSNGYSWYETPYLAQDIVFTETHYTDDWENGSPATNSDRVNAYVDYNGTQLAIPVPYRLSHMKTGKRFITETTVDNKKAIIFGNGLIRTGNSGSLETGFFDTDQAGITIPGETGNLTDSLNPFLGNATDAMGESPANTTLTVTYRVGGGLKGNVSVNKIDTIDSKNVIGGTNTDPTVTVINRSKASGGGGPETLAQIRQNAKAFFNSQNRVVTKEDYESRTRNLPAKFGNIAKVYCKRNTLSRLGNTNQINFDKLTDMMNVLWNNYDSTDGLNLTDNAISQLESAMDIRSGDGGITQQDVDTMHAIGETLKEETSIDNKIATIELYVLSWDENGHLTQTPMLVKQNIKKYLQQYRMITDEVKISDGFIINFGVMFDVVAQRNTPKEEVKLNCIDLISRYFQTHGQDFRAPLNVSDIQYLLMRANGVRSVNEVKITQGWDNTEDQTLFQSQGLYYYDSLYPTGGATNNSDYWYKYDFQQALHNGMILPSVEPAVFELKYPNTNIKGVVR